MSGHESERPKEPAKPIDLSREPSNDPSPPNDLSLPSEPSIPNDPSLSSDPNLSGDPYKDPSSDPDKGAARPDVLADLPTTDTSDTTHSTNLADPNAVGLPQQQPRLRSDAVSVLESPDELRLALNPHKPDEATLTALLDSYRKMLIAAGSRDTQTTTTTTTKTIPDRYEVIVDAVRKPFDISPEYSDKDALSEFELRRAKVDGSLRRFADSLLPNNKPPFDYNKLNTAGTDAIRNVLDFVEWVSAKTEQPLSNNLTGNLMELVGVAERIGRTVVEMERSSRAWSLAWCDKLARKAFLVPVGDRQVVDPKEFSALDDQLAKCDIGTYYKAA
jgi:hypothetical protein